MRKTLERVAWGSVIGVLASVAVALRDAFPKTSIIASLAAAALGGLARGIQDSEPWNGDDRRWYRDPQPQPYLQPPISPFNKNVPR